MIISFENGQTFFLPDDDDERNQTGLGDLIESDVTFIGIFSCRRSKYYTRWKLNKPEIKIEAWKN